jgi:DNA adenine methylase
MEGADVMTYYLGSKADHADEILKIILAKRKPEQAYVEPFVGGANVICRVPDADGPRIGADINPYMIALHTALGNGWIPPKTMDEATYTKIKKNPKKYPPELVGFAATGTVVGSMWFGQYIEFNDKKGTSRCGLAQAYALRDAPGLKGAKFICSNYDQLDVPTNSLIYCDPPYLGTTGYMDEHQEKWRAYKFWQWADKMVDDGHTIFVSEYTSPSPEIYKTPPRTGEHEQVMTQFRALQSELQKLEGPTPQDQADLLENLGAQIKDHESKRRDPCIQMAARWKIVWQKDVRVNFAADNEAGRAAKTETEKLFHREA